MKKLKIAATGAVLLAVAALGCAMVAPRYTATQAAALSHQELCLLGLQTTSLHADSNILMREYNGRLLAGRFTHASCMELQAAQRAADKAKAGAVDNAALGDLAYQLGQFIGSRGRAVPANQSPPNYAPIAPSTRYTSPAPYVPLPPISTLIGQDVNKTFSKKTCVYAGTSSVMIVQPHEQCPPNLPTANSSPNYAPGVSSTAYPTPAPYDPLPPINTLIRQDINQTFSSKKCVYAGTSAVMLVHSSETCPPSLPR